MWWNVFEYPFVGIGIAAIVTLGLWIYETFRPERKKIWHLFIPASIVIFSVALSYFVQTDNEKILAAVDKGIKAFKDKNIEPIREIVADDYSDMLHSSKEYIIAYCQALFETAAIDKVTFFSRKMDIENTKATFTFEAMVKFAENSRIALMGKPFLIVKAKLYFRKTADKKWLITSSEILELDRNPVDWRQIPH